MPPVARWKAISGGNANDEGATVENTRDSPRRTRSEGCDSDRTRTERFMAHVSKSGSRLVKAPKLRTNQVCFFSSQFGARLRSRVRFIRGNIFLWEINTDLIAPIYIYSPYAYILLRNTATF